MTQLLNYEWKLVIQHPPIEEYQHFLERHYLNSQTRRTMLGQARCFVQTYPDLNKWFEAPLLERVGHLPGGPKGQTFSPATFHARQYLYFLACQGYVRFDWEWLFVQPFIHVQTQFQETGLDVEIKQLAAEAIQLGYTSQAAYSRLDWLLSRIFLHFGFSPLTKLREHHFLELEEALQAFQNHPDMLLFFQTTQRFKKVQVMTRAATHKLHVLLYNRGQSENAPRVIMPAYAYRPVLKPTMQAIVERYLTIRKLTDRPGTITQIERSLRYFIIWLAHKHSELESLAEVTREHLLEYAQDLNELDNSRTKHPLATNTKRNCLSNLNCFFRNVAEWGWEGTPGRPLLGVGDLPKPPLRIPRYIVEEELSRLMEAIRDLECPYRRAALLIARWSGARRGEIQRLSVDCLDAYPDGTARLRLPAGKTKQERSIPLHEEAAEAIRLLQRLHRGDRGLRDDLTGIETRYLFMHFGKLYSSEYLFRRSIELVCQKVGLIDSQGKATITAHRFRHTLGTQLAEKGARLRTIMSVLGHESATMSMVYAQISDREVLKDYQAAVGPGVLMAGPFLENLNTHSLSEIDLNWLKTNFFKTELELGHCLRLPQEGPCECDLYLNCAKFITTRDYIPRLRHRHKIELELIEDANSHGWQREIERHKCVVNRIEQLLLDFGEPLERIEGEG